MSDHELDKNPFDELPAICIVKICTYLSGSRRSTFTRENYRLQVLRLLKVVPGLWTTLKGNFYFHLLIRGGVEESIQAELQERPTKVQADVFNDAYELAKACLASQRH